MEKCLHCGEKGVTYIPMSEMTKDTLSYFVNPAEFISGAAKLAKYGFSSMFDLDYEKKYVRGEVLKCKFCKAYHVECYNCLKISLMAEKPINFDRVLCPHCSKIMEIGNNELSRDNEIKIIAKHMNDNE